MLHALAIFAAAAAVQPTVSTEWLQAHLNDPQVRVICTGDRDDFDRGHIPGARFVDHMDTVGAEHHLLPLPELAKALSKAGAEDGAHIVVYGNSPMSTGWLYITLAAVGHGDDVSWLDGQNSWRDEKRPVSTERTAAGTGHLTVRPAPDIIVDAPWVRERLKSPAVHVLDVRTTREWNDGHLPGATLILWQDLFADQRTWKFKSRDEIRALLTRAGAAPNQEVVTYCAVGMRASLMYWAAKSAGLAARVYLGSFEDWRRDSSNPIAR
jgi:thiosulfate/3-mercaptopyruvate sulfurtransferase